MWISYHVILWSCPLSTCGISLHVLNSCQLVIMSACYHVNMSTCHNFIMSTCHLVILWSCPLSTCGISWHVLNSLQRLAKFCNFRNLLATFGTFFGNFFLLQLSSYQLAIMSSVSFLACKFASLWSSWLVSLSTCQFAHLGACELVFTWGLLCSHHLKLQIVDMSKSSCPRKGSDFRILLGRMLYQVRGQGIISLFIFILNK